MNNVPRYLTITSLAEEIVVDRATVERMMARGIISADAELKFGQHYTPLFLESKAVTVLIKRGEMETRNPRAPLPPRNAAVRPHEPSV